MYEIQQASVISGSLKRIEKVHSKQFADFMKKTQLRADEDKKKGAESVSIALRVMHSYAPYGVFQLKDMRKGGILVNFKLGGRLLVAV